MAADEDDVFFTETDRDGLVTGGKLAQRVDQLLSDYLVMQDYYVRKSIDKVLFIRDMNAVGYASRHL